MVKAKSWFTITRLIVYGTLSGLILVGAGIATITTGVRAVSRELERNDSTLFTQWHAPCDAVRIEKENELFFTSVKTQYLLEELTNDRMRQRATEKFKADSVKWEKGNK